MGAESNNKQVYDLRRIEDVFACLEIISVARGMLFGVDPDLARRMEKVSDALGVFSQLVLEGGLGEAAGGESFAPAGETAVAEPARDLYDLTVNLSPPRKTMPGPEQKKVDAEGKEDDIIDILTGEKIR
ncbi:MAG: hypothetical protein HY885_03590 [Deltaproteobacteria bacterium]|nr:hypothetical protein [Deltaproteobacteria bacterium]